MKIVVAMDSFKGSLSSKEAGTAVKQGIKRAVPGAEVDVIPMADGGEGSLDALSTALPGSFQSVRIHQLDGTQREARYFRSGNAAYIECAEAVGLTLINEQQREPSQLSSYGVGELIRNARENGCEHVYVFLGGSGTTDGGLGMLQALGCKCLDQSGRQLPIDKNPLLDTRELVMPAHLKGGSLFFVTDVENPYFGKQGAAYVFGPQKGMDVSEVPFYDEALQRAASLLNLSGTEKGAGAAGGIGGALYAIGANYLSGIQWMLQTLQVEKKVKKADLVLTGEGRIDEQTAYGKVPAGLGSMASKYSIPCIALAGQIKPPIDNLFSILTAAVSIQQTCQSLEEALKPEITEQQLTMAAEQVMRIWVSGNRQR